MRHHAKPDRALARRMAAEGFAPGVPGGLLVEELLPELDAALRDPCPSCGSRRVVPRCFARGHLYALFVLCGYCGQATEKL